MAQYAYGVIDDSTGELACIDYRVHVFWHKRLAQDFIIERELEGRSAKRVSITLPKRKS